MHKMDCDAEVGTRVEEVSAGVASRGKILVVEDDVWLQKALHRIFVDQHYTVLVAGDGLSALVLFREERPCAVILDLILPNISGRELCRKFKALASNTAVIVLSAIAEEVEKVLLFELGADDYVTKPFSLLELTARVEAAVRRQRRSKTCYRFHNWEIDFLRMNVQREGNPVTLTAYEFKLLKFFIENAEQVLSRDVLLSQVLGDGSSRATRVVDNQIMKLRQKLESDRANPRHLLTIRGVGYKFVP